jgi:hypothetical protein
MAGDGIRKTSCYDEMFALITKGNPVLTVYQENRKNNLECVSAKRRRRRNSLPNGAVRETIRHFGFKSALKAGNFQFLSGGVSNR